MYKKKRSTKREMPDNWQHLRAVTSIMHVEIKNAKNYFIDEGKRRIDFMETSRAIRDIVFGDKSKAIENGKELKDQATIDQLLSIVLLQCSSIALMAMDIDLNERLKLLPKINMHYRLYRSAFLNSERERIVSEKMASIDQQVEQFREKLIEDAKNVQNDNNA